MIRVHLNVLLSIATVKGKKGVRKNKEHCA